MAYSVPTNFAAGAVLTEAQLDVLGNDIVFLANPPRCRVYNSANISVNDATATALTFNSERSDTDTMHSTSVNTGRITFTTAGFYIVGFTGALATSNDYAHIETRLRLNGATQIASHSQMHDSISVAPMLSLVTGYDFSAGDYVEILVYQDNTASAARNVLAAANYSPEFWAIWQGL